MLRRADGALLKAKRDGRDRVTLASELVDGLEPRRLTDAAMLEMAINGA